MSEPRVGYLDKVLPDMREEVRRALARFWAAGIGGADFFVSAIGPALSVFSRYAEVRYGSGQPVSVGNFLTLVRQAVVEHALEEALKGVDAGDVDKETQFALLWRWTYKHKEVETGAAQLLDKATGVELRELERAGLLARPDPQRMVLLGPDERPDLLEGVLRRVQMGRGAELAALIRAYDRHAAAGYFAVIEGAAGIGKTRLAEEFLAHARGLGAMALAVRCYEGEADVAYAPVADALRGALAQTACADRPVRSRRTGWPRLPACCRN